MVLGLSAEAVKLAVLDSADERVPLIRREPEDGTRGVPAIPHADFAGGQVCHFDAVAVGET